MIIHSEGATGLRSQYVLTMTVTAYTDQVSFTVDSKVSGYGSLDVYNMMGQKVNILAGKQNFRLTLPTRQRLNLVYVLRLGNRQVAGKLLQLNR